MRSIYVFLLLLIPAFAAKQWCENCECSPDEQCVCHEGWFGPNCSVSKCSGNGLYNIMKRKCVCSEGYTGNFCEGCANHPLEKTVTTTTTQKRHVSPQVTSKRQSDYSYVCCPGSSEYTLLAVNVTQLFLYLSENGKCYQPNTHGLDCACHSSSKPRTMIYASSVEIVSAKRKPSQSWDDVLSHYVSFVESISGSNRAIEMGTLYSSGVQLKQSHAALDSNSRVNPEGLVTLTFVSTFTVLGLVVALGVWLFIWVYGRGSGPFRTGTSGKSKKRDFAISTQQQTQEPMKRLAAFDEDIFTNTITQEDII